MRTPARRFFPVRGRRPSLAAALAQAFLLVACGGGNGTGTGLDGGGLAGSTGLAGSAGAGSGSGGGSGGGTGVALPGIADGGAQIGAGGGATAGPAAYPCLQGKSPACAGQVYMGQQLPLDLHVMFDQSGSMAIMDDGQRMRLDVVRGAVASFLGASESRGIGVGISYFGHQPLTCGCTSCDPATYATPAVPVGLLPDHGAAIMGSLSRIEPVGETPTGAAIRGACLSASARKQSDPGRNPVILLVTDGEPKAPLTSMKGGCNPTLDDAVAAATACAASGIKTYVLGIGPALQNLHQIANAGRSGKAYLVENGGGPEILKALNAIRSDAMIPCSLQVPRPSFAAAVDPSKVNLLYSSASCGAVTTFLNVKQASGCHPTTGGWYYDDPASPTSIQLCTASCNAVKAPGGQLSISVGCSTQVIE